MAVGPQALRLLALVLLGGLMFQRGAPQVVNLAPRAGVVMVGVEDGATLSQLGQVSYYQYGFQGEDAQGHHRWLMVRPGFDARALAQTMSARPGAWWLVGNEPNDPHQDNLTPQAYAGFYRQVERTAVWADPSARLMPAGVSNADWRWCEAFVEAYEAQYGRRPRLAGWHMHNYVLEPAFDQLDLDIFCARIIAFRDWMDRAGYGELPLVLSEYGALYQMPEQRPGSDEALERYIAETTAWLAESGQVDSWFWFATETAGQFNGDLYDEAGRLTRFGKAYRQALQNEAAD